MLIKVVAALIKKENKILIAKRSTGDPNVLGKWEFPGGKVELNEDEFHAIEREILEEFEFSDKIIKKVGCKTINVTQRAIEDTALIILESIKNNVDK